MLRAKLLELLIYIIGYIVFIFLNLFIYNKFKNKKFACVSIVIILITYAGIRYNVGSDYDTYLKQYNEVFLYFDNVKKILTSDLQCGFTLLLYLTRKYIGGTYSIFWFFSILIYPFTIYNIKKESSNFAESLFLYFTLQFHMVSLNLLKQVASMTLLLKNKTYIIQNKIFKAILLTYLMMTFHITSFISVIILYISKHFNPTLKKMFITLFFSFIILLTYKPLIFNISFLKRYYRYVLVINKDYYIVTIGAIIYLISQMMILFILLKNKDKLIEKNPLNKVILSALILVIPFKVLAIDNFPIYRISLYIDQFLIFIIPDLLLIYKKNSKNYKKQYLMYVFFMIILLSLEIVFIPHNNFYTYQTIFSRGG